MVQNSDIDTFPRPLSSIEKELLFFVLPIDVPVYSNYRDKINAMEILGQGRFGETNYILGKPGSLPDLDIGSAPIFSIGKMTSKMGEADIIIHEEDEDQIEIDILISPHFNIKEIISSHSFSTWRPGENDPVQNNKVREIHLIKNKLVLAISKQIRRIWLYNSEERMNYIIPVTNYYNEVFKMDKNRKKGDLPDLAKFFDNLESFSDQHLGQAFLSYNKYLNKINLDYEIFKKKNDLKSRKSFLSKIFSNRS